MDFSNLKTLIIPEGEVQEIKDSNGQVLWSAEESPVPPGYTAYKWIGREINYTNPYIDTEIQVNSDFKIEISFLQELSKDRYRLLVGAFEDDSFSTTKNKFGLQIDCRYNQIIYYFGTEYRNVSNLQFNEENVVSLDKSGLYLNNEKVYTPSETSMFEVKRNLYCFAISGSLTTVTKNHMHIFNLKVYDENKGLIFDGIPVKNKTEKIGLYNLSESPETSPFYGPTNSRYNFICGNEF